MYEDLRKMSNVTCLDMAYVDDIEGLYKLFLNIKIRFVNADFNTLMRVKAITVSHVGY